MYAPAIELAVTTGNNAYACKTVVYAIMANSSTSFGSAPGTLIDGAITNGWHKVTIKVWDSNGSR